MAERIQFHEKRKGALGENEDWWRLVVTDNGMRQIEHEWSYTNAYKAGQSNSGTKIYKIEDFLKGDHDSTAKEKLAGLLRNRGEA